MGVCSGRKINVVPARFFPIDRTSFRALGSITSRLRLGTWPQQGATHYDVR
jgi:hypothetical protein